MGRTFMLYEDCCAWNRGRFETVPCSAGIGKEDYRLAILLEKRDQSPKLMPSILASLMMEASGSTIFSLPATSFRGTLTISRFL